MRPEAHEHRRPGGQCKGPEVHLLIQRTAGAQGSADRSRENAGRAARSDSRAMIGESVGVNPLILRGNS